MDSELAALARRYGRNLSRCRIDAGMTVTELAEAARISPWHLSEIENGKEIAPGDLLFILAAVLDADLDDLAEGVEWREPPDGAFYVDGERVPPPEER